MNEHPVKEMAEIALSEINEDNPHFSLSVIYQSYEFSTTRIFESVCSVLDQGIVGIIASGASTNVKVG